MMVVLVALESQILLTASDTWQVPPPVPPMGAWPLHECSTEEEFLIRSNANIIERFKLGGLALLGLWSSCCGR